MIKAPAEQICGSGVLTSEKSMAAAVAVLLFCRSPIAGMKQSQHHVVCLLAFLVLDLLSAKWPDSPRHAEVD